MKLKSFYASKDEIPSEYFGLFKERDGKWYLDEVEDMEPKARVDEFRQTNIQLRQQLDDEKAKWKDLDPTRVRELMQKASDLDDAKLVKKEGFDAAVAQKVEQTTAAMRTAHEAALRDRDDKYAKLNQQFAKVTIEQAAVAECGKLGAMKPGAADFVTNLALGVFKVENGVPVAYEADGTTKKYNKDGKPYTREDFAKDTLDKYGYLWVGNSGGGGDSGKRGGGGKYEGPNPYDDKSINYTEQARLVREDPEEAKRLHRAAGKGELQIMEDVNRGATGE